MVIRVPEPVMRLGQLIASHKGVRSIYGFREPHMAWMRRVFGVPASETQMGLVLALSIFSLSLMSIALVWQAQVIAKQNAVIHLLETKFGG
jgi:hypothetical protein